MITSNRSERDPRKRLHELISLLLEQAISVEEFCRQFETTYNIELDKSQLRGSESTAFAVLFNKVVWYSPFPEERKRIPNYLGEQDVLDTVRDTERMLTAAKAEDTE